MSTFLTVFFAFIAGGATMWAMLQLHMRYALRRGLRHAAAEQAAQEGLRRMGAAQLAAEAEAGYQQRMDAATIHNPPRFGRYDPFGGDSWPYDR